MSGDVRYRNMMYDKLRLRQGINENVMEFNIMITNIDSEIRKLYIMYVKCTFFMTKKNVLGWMIYGILYPISGIMLLILLYDVYTGNAYIKNGSTLPAKYYIIVLVALVHVMYRRFKDILMK